MLQIGGQMAQKPTFIPNCAILGYNYYCSKHKLYCLYDINFLSRRSTSRSISGIAQQHSIVTKVMNIPETVYHICVNNPQIYAYLPRAGLRMHDGRIDIGAAGYHQPEQSTLGHP